MRNIGNRPRVSLFAAALAIPVVLLLVGLLVGNELGPPQVDSDRPISVELNPDAQADGGPGQGQGPGQQGDPQSAEVAPPPPADEGASPDDAASAPRALAPEAEIGSLTKTKPAPPAAPPAQPRATTRVQPPVKARPLPPQTYNNYSDDDDDDDDWDDDDDDDWDDDD